MPLEKLGKQILYICTVGALPGVSLWHVFTEARHADSKLFGSPWLPFGPTLASKMGAGGTFTQWVLRECSNWPSSEVHLGAPMRGGSGQRTSHQPASPANQPATSQPPASPPATSQPLHR